MLWRGIRWNALDLKVLTFVCLIGSGDFSADYSAKKSKDKFILICLSVDSHQPIDSHVQARLFLHLAHDRFRRQFAAFDAPAGEIPYIKVAPMAEQHPALMVENDRKCPD